MITEPTLDRTPVIDLRCLKKAECRTMAGDTAVLDFMGDPFNALYYKIRSDGSVLIEVPWTLTAPSLRSGIRWLLENREVWENLHARRMR